VFLAVAIFALGSTLEPQARPAARRITWVDTSPLHARLEAQGITSATFASYVERVHQANARRVREGDLDHLVFYALQSTHFTPLPTIEPALSAKALVDSLDAQEREAFLKTSQAPLSRIPASVRSRLAALLRALDASDRDPRLVYFRGLVNATFPMRGEREAALMREYLRAMWFVYEKEFIAQRSARASEAVAELYRARGLSTDTAVEAGYLVYLGLGVVKSLEPDRRVRRVLIVGPGLDLAPRTALLEVGPPQSYQPWAIIDALLALGLSRAGDLDLVAADINPRVVEHLRRSHTEPPRLSLLSEIRESEAVKFSEEFRDYFARLGSAIGRVDADARSMNGTGHLHKTVRVDPAAARALRAETLDVVTERLDEAPFDIIIATNILPYFDNVELMLAMSNIARMLAPGGVFLHNEARPLMQDVTAALGLPFEQSRQAIIASVGGVLRPRSGQAPAPLGDSVWLHRKARSR
jgi:SAM-dependent methyltransferase